MRPSPPFSIFKPLRGDLVISRQGSQLTTLVFFGKEQGTLSFTTGKCYTPSGYDSILRLVTARDQVLQSFCYAHFEGFV